jgi:hypothetical protein
MPLLRSVGVRVRLVHVCALPARVARTGRRPIRAACASAGVDTSETTNAAAVARLMSKLQYFTILRQNVTRSVGQGRPMKIVLYNLELRKMAAFVNAASRRDATRRHHVRPSPNGAMNLSIPVRISRIALAERRSDSPFENWYRIRKPPDLERLIGRLGA